VGVNKVEFYVDDSLKIVNMSAPYTYSLNTTQLAEGAHTIMVKAFDAAGNNSSAQVLINVDNIVADTVAPVVSAFSLPATAASLTVAITAFTAADNIGVTGYLVTESATKPAAGAAGWSASAPTSYTFASAGAKTLYAWAKDAADNVSASKSASVTITLPDTIAPSVPTNLVATAVSASQINLSWIAATDNVGVTGYRIYRNGAQIATTAQTSYANTGLAAATAFTYKVAAYDAAGNVSAQSAQVTATTNAQPPTVSITSPRSGVTIKNTITVSVSAASTLAISKVELYMDSTLVGTDTASPYSFSWNTTKTSNGTHVLTAKAYDAAGTVGTSASVSVNVRNPKVKATLTLAPSAAFSVKALNAMSSDMSEAIFAITVDRAGEPNFPTSDSFQGIVSLPSGNKTLTLSRLGSDDSRYYIKTASGSFSAQDFSALGGSAMTITINGQEFDAEGIANAVLAGLGGAVMDSQGLSLVVVPPNRITSDAQINIAAPTLDGATRRETALKQQSLKGLDAGREIMFTSSGTLASAIVVLPFDPALLPSGLGLDRVRVAYFNPATGAWEVQEKATVVGNTVQTVVNHFSLYAPVALLPSATPGLRNAYAYPNPAIRDQVPTIRAFMGELSRLEVTIFDVAGNLVHSGSVTGAPTGVLNGEFYYDYPWAGRIASGTYYAVMHGKAANGATVRARAQFAVVR
jgi:chitodextrinase